MSDYWAEADARIRKTVENGLMQAVGLPIPHPEHDDELRRRHEEHERKRAQWIADWRARDVIDRLLTLDERFDLDDQYADYDIDDAVAEIERLRAQVAELLPFLVAHIQGTLALGPAPQDHDSDDCPDCYYYERALCWQRRIDAGEFGEVA